ncbi:MAG TPA: SLC13 family permease [Kofleriaceae bacterium]|nr:SLC13 family permease [Kofleriaceae bacterium]
MSADMAFVLIVCGAAIVLFVSEWLPMDQVAIAVPPVLLVGGAVDLETAISGLSNPATIAVAGFLVIGLALDKTGVVRAISRLSARLSWGTPGLRLFALCMVVAGLSPFLSNTAVVVVFMPVFLGLAAGCGQQPSRVLIPLSYAAILGGTITLIGTSTNLIVQSAARNRGFDELSLFSIAPLGLIYLAVGMTYLMTIGRRLLPDRPSGSALDAAIANRVYTTELRVTERSSAVGKNPRELPWREKYGLQEVRPLHPWYTRLPRAPASLRAGDFLCVTGDANALFSCARGERLETPVGALEDSPDDSGEVRVIELMVAPGGMYVGCTIQDLKLATRFEVVVLGVQRARRPLRGRMTRERLVGGDLLLVQGASEALMVLADHDAFVAIGEAPRHDLSRGPGWLALAILAAVVVASATGIASIPAAALVGAIAMVFSACVRVEEIYRDLDWPIIALLAGLLPLGAALDTSGAADFLGRELAGLIGDTHPSIAIGCFYLATSLLTEVMSNQAAAIVLTPLAITTAQRLDMNPYALIVTVMFGASAAFMTPMGYQTNVLVYGPGGYRFTDYLRVGAPLNLLLAGVAALAIPWLWP